MHSAYSATSTLASLQTATCMKSCYRAKSIASKHGPHCVADASSMICRSKEKTGFALQACIACIPHIIPCWTIFQQFLLEGFAHEATEYCCRACSYNFVRLYSMRSCVLSCIRWAQNNSWSSRPPPVSSPMGPPDVRVCKCSSGDALPNDRQHSRQSELGHGYLC